MAATAPITKTQISIAKPQIDQTDIDAVVAALQSGQLTGGPIVAQFETDLAAYSGYKHAVVVSSGTAALHIAMHALGVGSGDEVVVPDFTFIATANAARYVGATPVFADVDSRTFNLDAESLQSKISSKTKAIIPVSLYGQSYDVDAISKIASEHGIPVVSDNCQAIGTAWNSKRNLGDAMATLSFYPTKNMTSTEGGAILTDRDDLADQCRLWRNIGQRKPYDYANAGYNYRLNSVSAALGLSQLKRLDAFMQKRQENARMLSDLLAGVSGIQLPYADPHATHVYNQYTLQVDAGAAGRDALKAHLAALGVGSNVYYPMPLSQLDTFGKDKGPGLPNANLVSSRVLSIPVHPGLSEADVHTVADAVKSFRG
ncbi:DegT/DnrJ/EryC1/StrS family aminotransferase [Candidatus Micrarchaeota archaeon]|nr:DegT/DnrJ/EryC1/StrS family aminotransferase [Candidatus Micrarchaeota archaeon]